ncbi:MAG: cytochrome c oxidase subunit 3 [Saccharospirillum sp.]|nr:cytochrome c oxidase subunit 3 [Saccharospirillum sp.]
MSSSTTHEHYYVPAQSRLPLWMAFSMFLTVFGMGGMMVDMTTGRESSSTWIFIAGFALLSFVMYTWFAQAIRENHAGLNSEQLKRSYVWGMGWFIFSEVFFFLAFFGALFYVRVFVGPWLGGEGAKGVSNYLWEGFEFTWPMMSNPDNSIFQAPQAVIGAFGLPLINTIILIASSITLTVAHHALKAEHRKQLNIWLAVTIALAVIFLFLQAMEYVHAYQDLGLTLSSGIYGSTFFLLTGFHGVHVTIGTLMLVIMLIRSLKGHFKPNDHFGFEAAAWYWHFVDVVWVIVFVVVYWF